VEAKRLIQTRAKFCEVFALKICLLVFVNKIVPRYLSIVQVLLSFAAASNIYCDLLICESKSVEKPPLQSPVHKRKGHLKLLCSLTRKVKNCESSGTLVSVCQFMLLLHQSTMRIV